MKLAITIVFLVLSVIMAVVILMQESKSNGLTSSLTGGSSDTYWGKNKGRSKEAVMEKITIAFAILFFALSLILSIGLIK